MGHVLRDADAKLSQVREESHPDAGGLVVAADQEHARAIAARLARVAAEEPEVVMSDEPEASARIAAFRASRRRWLVSVLMVSEGVDIPRLRVGVYATAVRTELFFRQVVGRLIRRTPEPASQMSYLLLPADTGLKQLAVKIEEERRHALDLEPREDDGPIELERRDREDDGERFEALSSTGAQLDEAILSETTLQLFPTEEPARRVVAPPPPPLVEESAFASRERLRGERATLVARLARRTGETHRDIHARINRATGARSVGAATRAQLEKGNALLGRELSR
jgi:hypothetical protein